jgi:hypothetical protein
MLELRYPELGLRQTVYDADGLVRAARTLLADGPRLRTPDGGDRAALLWLAELAAHRSDWREAVKQACAKLAETPVGLEAVWELLAEAPAAVLLVDVAEQLLAQRGASGQAVSTTERLRGLAAQRFRRPLPLPLPGKLFILAEAQQLHELLDYLLGRLDDLAPRQGLDGWQTLWMLRDAELTQPWTRDPLAMALQAELLGEQEERRAAVLEYLAVSGDLTTRIPLIQIVLEQGGELLAEPAADLPSGLSLRDLLAPLYRGDSVGEVLACLLELAQAERPPAVG